MFPHPQPAISKAPVPHILPAISKAPVPHILPHHLRAALQRELTAGCELNRDFKDSLGSHVVTEIHVLRR